MEDTRQGNLTGVLFMLIGMIGMGAVDATGKWLVTGDYPVVQVIAVRGWFISAALIAWMAYSGRLAEIKTNRPWGHCLRLMIGFLGPLFMFRALGEMPLADVTVIIFGSTFMTTALAVPLFKEKVGPHRWTAVILGFVGVVIALRPGSEVFEPVAIFALVSGLAFAGINLTARWLRDTESTLQIVFFLMLGMTLLASAITPTVWVPIRPGDWAVFAAMGVFTLVGYFFMTQAFVVAPVGLVAPFEYTVLIWAVLFGFLLWGDVPDQFVWTGAAIIVASGIYLIYREGVSARRASSPDSETN